MYTLGTRITFIVTDNSYFDYLKPFNNKKGTIVVIEDNDSIGVCFDEPQNYLHSLMGNCETNHGYWFTEKELSNTAIYLIDDVEIDTSSEDKKYPVKNPAIYTKIKLMQNKRKVLGYAY